MATKQHGRLPRPGRPLFDLYEQYVGEPQSRKDVYGYWTFLAGYALGVVGVAVYLIGITPGSEQFFIREVAITLSAIGLALALFGFGLMLPVRLDRPVGYRFRENGSLLAPSVLPDFIHDEKIVRIEYPLGERVAGDVRRLFDLLLVLVGERLSHPLF